MKQIVIIFMRLPGSSMRIIVEMSNTEKPDVIFAVERVNKVNEKYESEALSFLDCPMYWKLFHLTSLMQETAFLKGSEECGEDVQLMAIHRCKYWVEEDDY